MLPVSVHSLNKAQVILYHLCELKIDFIPVRWEPVLGEL
jgi:hypothetical protein